MCTCPFSDYKYFFCFSYLKNKLSLKVIMTMFYFFIYAKQRTFRFMAIFRLQITFLMLFIFSINLNYLHFFACFVITKKYHECDYEFILFFIYSKQTYVLAWPFSNYNLIILFSLIFNIFLINIFSHYF